MKKTGSARRRPKGDKRDRTRAALLEAARAEILEKGYARTTLEAVARRAGMTTGAIYGNFRNRDELFIALGEAYWAPIKTTDQAWRDVRRRDARDGRGDASRRSRNDRRRRWDDLTGLAYALTSPDLRERVLAVTADSYEFGAEWLRTLGDERDLPMPPEQLVRVIHALIEGLVMQRILTAVSSAPDDESVLLGGEFGARVAAGAARTERQAVSSRPTRVTSRARRLHRHPSPDSSPAAAPAPRSAICPRRE